MNIKDDFDNLNKDYQDLKDKYDCFWNIIPPDMNGELFESKIKEDCCITRRCF